MEGPSIRRFPRMVLDKPVEITCGEQTVSTTGANLSVGGLAVSSNGLPVGTPVHLRINGSQAFEADGVVCYGKPNGSGIEFKEVTRETLDALIADLTRRGLPAS